jgi:hypothetical protein
MRRKNFLYILLVIAIIIVYLFFKKMQNEYDSITTYEECLDAGYSMIATYPEQCKIPGKTFVNQTQKGSTDIVAATTTDSKNYKSATYKIEGELITLKNGIALTPSAPGSASIDTMRYFGNEVRGDFDKNGTEDIAFLMTKESGGSGTFFYLAVALLLDNQLYSGINTIFLGDRIAPQTTELKNDQIVVNYADRMPNDPMTKKPSIGVSRYFKIINHSLVEVTE